MRFDLAPLYQTTVGFDRYQDLLERIISQDVAPSATGYPPYNIEKTSEENYVISIAVAGFNSDDLEIEVRENKLLVSGKKEPEPEGRVYLHKGIGLRSFQRNFQLADHVKVVSAEFVDGLLNITLQREIPEAYKPRKISIGSGKANGSAVHEGKSVEVNA